MPLPPLRSLHPDSSLLTLKLETLNRVPTHVLIESLQPNQKDSLKVRTDGTILDGHHRIAILRARGIDVDTLPRETIVKLDLP